MTKKELLDNPIFKEAHSDAYMFFCRNYGREEQETWGLGELCQTQVKGEIRFNWSFGWGAMTKEEILNNKIFKKARNDYELSFCSSGTCHISYQVEVVLSADGDIILRDSFIDQDGTRVYL